MRGNKPYGKPLPKKPKKIKGTLRGEGPRGKKKTKRTPIPVKIQKIILTRSKGYCEYCKEEFYSNKEMPEFHHINGNASDHRLSNIVALCPRCHRKADRHIITPEQLRYSPRRTPLSASPNLKELNRLLLGR